MKNLSPILFLLLCLGITSCTPYRQLAPAFGEIRDMDQGVLLVQLASTEDTTTRSQRYGQARLAPHVCPRPPKELDLIMQSFGEYFHFCPVYFCYKEDVPLILDQGQTDLLLGKEYVKDFRPEDLQKRNLFFGFVEPVLLDPGLFINIPDEHICIRDENGYRMEDFFPDWEVIGVVINPRTMKRAVVKLDRELTRFSKKRARRMARKFL